MDQYSIRRAVDADKTTICALLNQYGMVTDGVLAPHTVYWLAESTAGNLLGVVGIERGDKAALLRSAAVLESERKRGIGAALVSEAVAYCCTEGMPIIYCFSTDAGTYWQRTGFVSAPVSELLDALPFAPQVIHFDQIGWLPTEIAWRLDLHGC